jgi:hypothetical protein
MRRLQAPLFIIMLLTCANLFAQQLPIKQPSLFDELQIKDARAHREMMKNRLQPGHNPVNQYLQPILQQPQ